MQELVDGSTYRPELLREASLALGLLGDKDAVPALVGRLRKARGLAQMASISAALGLIGDQRSVEPLVELLQDEDVPATARAFAAVALGFVGDKERLPWRTRLVEGLNYVAAPSTLIDPAGSNGILNIR